MKYLILIGMIFASLTMLSGCNTVKGAADGFNRDMDSLTGHNSTAQTTTTTSNHNHS